MNEKQNITRQLYYRTFGLEIALTCAGCGVKFKAGDVVFPCGFLTVYCRRCFGIAVIDGAPALVMPDGTIWWQDNEQTPFKSHTRAFLV